jgi:hypothetical protein
VLRAMPPRMQAIAKGELRKRHAQKLIEVRELERRISASDISPHTDETPKAKSLSRIQIGDIP